MTRRHHGKETYALFIDLVKAFDSINREALYLILKKYGLPEELINVIKKMYLNCSVQIKVGAEKRDVEYTSGVLQGDNAAAVLFLFVMQAATETFTPIQNTEEEVEQSEIEFRYFEVETTGKKQNGRLLGQDSTSKEKN
jgi:hypothetical protein